MTGRIKKHFLYYVGLLLMQSIGLLLVFFAASDKFLQLTVITFMTLCYVLWCILHHHLHHDLTLKIMIEYILIGLLGLVIAIFFLHIL